MTIDMNDARNQHERLIVQQFTSQVDRFREFAEIRGQPWEVVLSAARVGRDDTIVDVACGPGVTTCDLAEVAGHVTGIDATPAMIDRARELQRQKGLANVSWVVQAVPPLPFDDQSFSLAFSRYSFHHFLDPLATLREMARVCKVGGRVVVVDVFMSTADQAEAFNRMEKLRDPSHVRALLLSELEGLFEQAALERPTMTFYRQSMTLESLIRGSFPAPGDADCVREMIAGDLGKEKLGLEVACIAGDVQLAYPIAVLVGRKTENDG